VAAGIAGCQQEARSHHERVERVPTASCPAPEGDLAPQTGAALQGGRACGGSITADRLKQDSGLLRGRRGRLTSPDDRRKALEILDEGIAIVM
jgi:hypothetical protein